jgi:Arc/MetJ family transcription regulator
VNETPETEKNSFGNSQNRRKMAMKTTSIPIPDQLLREALAATGMDQPEALVHLALREMISRRREGGSAAESDSEANKELAKLFGSWTEEEYRQIQGAIDEERRKGCSHCVGFSE